MMALMVALSATSSYATQPTPPATTPAPVLAPYSTQRLPAAQKTQKFVAVNSTGLAPVAMVGKKVGGSIFGANQTQGGTRIFADAGSFQTGSQIALNTGGSVSGGSLVTGNNQLQGNTVQVQALSGGNLRTALNAMQTKKGAIATTSGTAAAGDLVLARPEKTYSILRSQPLGVQNFANAITDGSVAIELNDANGLASTMGNIGINNNKQVMGTQVQAGSNLSSGSNFVLVGTGGINS
jgi:hypothetical protein